MKATWRGFTSILADGIQAFLEYKRAIKRKFRSEEMTLRLLDRYLVEHQINTLTSITPLLIEGFINSRPRKQPRSYNHLLARISHSPCRKRDFRQGEDGVPDEAVGTG